MNKRWQIMVAVVTWLFAGNTACPEALSVDLRDVGTSGSQDFAQVGDGFQIEGVVTYDARDQSMQMTGTYRSSRAIEKRAPLSYQIYDDNGKLLMADGARFGWEGNEGGELVAQFELDFLFLDQLPNQSGLAVQFNAVVEAEYWYSDEFPEIEFGRLQLDGVPRRDAFSPGWVYRPRFLPAQSRVRFPTWWRVDYSDAKSNGFVGTLDVRLGDSEQRRETPREPWKRAENQGDFVWQWQVLEPVPQGTYQVRPGLVWDRVRWYEVSDWFEYQEVRFVSPLGYLAAVVILMALLGWGWTRTWEIERRGIRWGLVSGLTVASGWWGLNVWMSGSWMSILAVGAAYAVVRFPWEKAGARIYACTLIFACFTEAFWGQLNAITSVWTSASIFSMAVWALLLAPLLLVRQRWLRRVVVGVVMAGWLFISTGSVFYYRFFQDFPSIENLIYAGQIGELGDSIVSLGQQSFLIPVVVGGLIFAMVCGAGTSAKKLEPKN